MNRHVEGTRTAVKTPSPGTDDSRFRAVAATMIAWGALNSAILASRFDWPALGIKDEPEGGGGLTVAAIQLAIMLGGSLGAVLLHHHSVGATFVRGSALLLLASIAVGSGNRLRPETA